MTPRSPTPTLTPTAPDSSPEGSAATAPFDLDRCLERAREASRLLAEADRDGALRSLAEALEGAGADLLAANARDLERERAKGTKDALLDRLALSEARLGAMAEALRLLADLPDPLGRSLLQTTLPNGLRLERRTVPFGVIGVIYESRPNVTVDAASLALKAGSAVVLRGSSNALESNRALVKVMRGALGAAGLPEDAVQLVDSPERALVSELLAARGRLDLVIPRGGAGLIRHVVETAKVPVIETGVGNCHLFVDASADPEQALAIALNAKVQRPGVCNSIETLLVHRDLAAELLPSLLGALAAAGVTLYADPEARRIVPACEVATEADWATEYLDLKLAVRVVADVDEAIDHINRYGSQHSEAILTRDAAHAERFQNRVDAAAVYVNASTRFTDGFAFGFGAEIGISTQKLHARGPLGLAELVTYKYLIEGTGQTRP